MSDRATYMLRVLGLCLCCNGSVYSTVSHWGSLRYVLLYRYLVCGHVCAAIMLGLYGYFLLA